MRTSRWLATLLLTFSALSCLHAQQILANHRYLGNQVVFTFQWKTASFPTPQALSFSLPIADVKRGDAEFDALDQKAANAYAFKRVEHAVATQQGSLGLPPNTTIQVKPVLTGYTVEAIGPQGAISQEALQPAMDKLAAIRDKGMDDYLWEKLYMNIGDNRIMPDHKRIAARYAPALAPMASAVQLATARLKPRDQINWLIGYFQTIPYNQLLDRYTSNGAGFKTPYGLLLGNQGDCDTKTVAMAAILRRLYPSMRLTMVYTPGHAFLGIGVQQGKSDYALQLGQHVFVLADPTGPRQLKLGEVAPEALAALNSGQYSYQEIP